ncbi:SDR family NAD(P)-dependent oxidoreductase [Nesterenkonia haasae]|uniref:SDR family NAD(P)-dependent oxidoreductase n=1 Tax=Nesterenkonia haasae TaxID=2587813 RepID=UPI001390D66B|nr:SDR family oxidoreductase [Nesterenkonia haasae]NDK32780.1 SDR family oxidoreductase [Nesterenkonia haasae]
MQYAETTVLVTGASSGIGAEFARQVAHRGAEVVLVGRREDALQELAAEITSRTGRQTYVVASDLGDENSGALLKKRLDGFGLSIDTVINCAGAGLTKPFMDSTPQEIRAQIQLNNVALVDICHAFLPELVASGRGALVNIGSLTGYMPVAGMAVYSAAKAFTIRFTAAIAHELRSAGLTVMAVSPGPTRTEFFARSGTSSQRTHFQTPDQVVTTALRALDKRRPPVSIVSGRANQFIRLLVSLLPTRATLKLAEARPAV